MGKNKNILVNRLEALCRLGDIDFEKFLIEMEIKLKNRIKDLLTPNENWFKEGKTLKRYWRFVEEITRHKWEYTEVEDWYKMLRGPSEMRDEIPLSLRYEVLTRDKSTCQKCGRKAPKVELEVDHIVPWSCGGPTAIDNLQTLCTDCNQGKLNKCFEGGN